MSTLTVADVGERALIERMRARIAPAPWVLVGPGDDAAIVVPERGALEAVTTDALVEGVHFDRRFVPPDAIGYRALAVNLSDLAAMGAQPRLALLSLMLPAALPLDDLDGLIAGTLGLAAAHRVALAGGNITRSPGPLVIDVAAVGSVKPRRMLLRSGARAGDDVYVTGLLGDAAVGLRSLEGVCNGTSARDALLADCEARYLRPAPRVRAGVLLGRNRAASSCMDLSDGLADAVRQIAAASGVGMVIDADSLPISAAARHFHEARGGSAIETALTGGDDYELVFTSRPAQRGRLRGVRQQLGDLPIRKIGKVTRDRALVVAGDGSRALPDGFEHFR